MKPSRKHRLLALLVAGLMFPSHLSWASSQVSFCNDATGQYEMVHDVIVERTGTREYKGSTLATYPIETTTNTCVDAKGNEYTSGQSIVVHTVKVPEITHSLHFLCVSEWDTYPNVSGPEIQCVKTERVVEKANSTSVAE